MSWLIMAPKTNPPNLGVAIVIYGLTTVRCNMEHKVMEVDGEPMIFRIANGRFLGAKC